MKPPAIVGGFFFLGNPYKKKQTKADTGILHFVQDDDRNTGAMILF